MLQGTILAYDLHNTKKRRNSYLYRDIVQFLRQYMFRNGGGSEWNGLYEDCSSIRFFFCRDAMLLKVVVFPVGLCAFLMSLWFPYNREQSSGREQVKQSKKCGDGLESKPPYLSILLFLSHSQKSKAESFPSYYSLVIGHWDTQSSALDIEYLPMLILDMTYKPHIARRNVHSYGLHSQQECTFLRAMQPVDQHLDIDLLQT